MFRALVRFISAIGENAELTALQLPLPLFQEEWTILL